VVVQLCHHVSKLSQKPSIRQWLATTIDSKLAVFQSDLDLWAASIMDEVNILMAQQIANEATQHSRFRSVISWRHESDGLEKQLRARKHTLDTCSDHGHEANWKRTRKLGNSSIYKQSDEYSTWKSQTDSSTLLCVGKLGSGKSVLLANVVDDLVLDANATATIAYFFCQHDALESLKARTEIGCVGRQILQPIRDLTPIFDFLLEHPARDLSHLCSLLKAVLGREYRAYIVLDGLESCDNGERTAILGSLRQLQDLASVSLCISIRQEASSPLISSFECFPRLSSFYIPDVNPDIDDFITLELTACLESGSLALHDPRLILDIQESLSKGAQGMFLWVALQIKALCLKRTDAGIRQAITNLPTDLSDTYDTILQKGGISDLSYQSKILQLIAVACRPLTTEEMREALSIIPGDTNWHMVEPTEI
jgi:hypothetical protein